MKKLLRRPRTPLLALCVVVALAVGLGVAGAVTGSDSRLTNDCHATSADRYTATPDCGVGYVSDYFLATNDPSYDAGDPTLSECTVAKGRQNEPAVAVDPRDTSVLVGSSNDYCGVYNASDPTTHEPVPSGPIWIGYYRSQDSGSTWASSLVPGYPGDNTPYAKLAKIRTASSGDPVIAWDRHGRVFYGAEASDDPAGTVKTFGDQFVARFVNPTDPNGTATSPDTTRDGVQFAGSVTVAKGSSAPNLNGKFNDKTAIEVDRTSGACDGYVYYAWSRFTNGKSDIYFVRSTDHGVSFSQPALLTNNTGNVQDPSIAVTGNGHVYVTWDQDPLQNGQPQGIGYVKSVNCGRSFSQEQLLLRYQGYAFQDQADPEEMSQPQAQPDDPMAEEEAAGDARDCGDFDAHCLSGYTFFRGVTNTRATADQKDTTHEWVYLTYDAIIPGTVVATGTSYGDVDSGDAGQIGAYFARFNGAAGSVDPGFPKLIEPEPTGRGHQLFPAVYVEGGPLHVMWWDSRNDDCYDVTRPVGNCPDRSTDPALDAYGSSSTDNGDTFAVSTRLSTVTSNPDYEQFADREVPFAGDYLWVTAEGSFAYSTWTDWRNTVSAGPGSDPREVAEDEDLGTSDVVQCRHSVDIKDKKGNVVGQAWSGDTCPHAGGLDQNIYGSVSP